MPQPCTHTCEPRSENIRDILHICTTLQETISCDTRPLTFVVFDLAGHDGQTQRDVELMAAHNSQELKLVLVKNLKHTTAIV